MNYYGTSGEKYLAHHGILGMKWGVRRFQNPDGSLTSAGKKRYSKEELQSIRDEKRKHYDKAYKSNPDFKKARQLEKEAYELTKKYDFNADDGGGGRTRVDQAAGRKYTKLLDEVALLKDSAEVDSRKETEKYITDKYGRMAMDQLNKQDQLRGMAMAAGFMAIPIGGLAWVFSLDKR